MFAYCGNNPVMNTDSSGELFFTAMGAVCGFIGSTVTSLLKGNDLSTAIDNGVAGAVGGAIAGFGVDAALWTIGTLGITAPAILLGCAVAYVAGGVGNVVTADLSSDAPIEPTVQMYNFVIGGTFNCLSLATSFSCVGKSMATIDYLGLSGFDENFIAGVNTAITSGIATEFAMSNSAYYGSGDVPAVEVFP